MTPEKTSPDHTHPDAEYCAKIVCRNFLIKNILPDGTIGFLAIPMTLGVSDRDPDTWTTIRGFKPVFLDCGELFRNSFRTLDEVLVLSEMMGGGLGGKIKELLMEINPSLEFTPLQSPESSLR